MSVVQVESGMNPLAIGVNGKPRIAVSVATPQEAAAKASALIAAGRSVDLGLAQINSKNLGWLGLSVEAAFDPCRNLAAAGRVLQAGYRPSAELGEQPALMRALSRYNTGDDQRGFRNGYVAKVTKAAVHIVPAIRAASVAEPQSSEEIAAAPPARSALDVFGEAGGSGGFLIRTSQPAPLQPGAQE
ncbi:MAG: lytic transglycosylase domain-containing protein [Caulobacteraceae bacterium]|nr:lytic transglycosylase domain-containing protein [Caulobacteraceae bacterium]